MSTSAVVHQARFDELTTRQLHDLVRLRIDVFVVEQECPYPELDGRDIEPGTVHLWVESEGDIAAYLRVLQDPEVHRIGRVVTAAAHRGQGHAARLMELAIESCPGAIELDAQSYLREWYEGFGFVTTGDEFIEDDIPHLPMRREPG